MPLAEFSLIERFFRGHGPRRDDVRLGIGDDAALVQVPLGHELVIATDTLVAGVHFPKGVDAASIGHKALAVNLSDLAAMGAQPAWASLALTLPEADESWLQGFAQGFFALAQAHQVELIGGDTTRGPLNIGVQVQGLVPLGTALRRSGAVAGDGIYVSGSLGDAAAGLHGYGEPNPDTDQAFLLERLHRPQPRLALGDALRGLATAAIDVSDGLLADLGHILEASGAGAVIDVDALPRSSSFVAKVAPSDACYRDWPLAGGDDYELCFTMADARLPVLRERLADSVPIHRIGTIEAGHGVRCRDRDGQLFLPEQAGYQHFRSP